MSATKDLVLVTGGSGFIAGWCVLYALQRGYRVRTTVRSLERANDVREMLINGGATQDEANSVEFCAADLTKDDGWPEATKDCVYVLHVASPFPLAVPNNEDDLIVPAREGTLRALRASKAAGTVKRVVVTSSFAAIGYGHAPQEQAFTEESWTDLENSTYPVRPYPKSKTIAERAAWDYIAKEGGDMELTVVNPVGVIGPILSKDAGTSVEIVLRMLNGLPALPKIYASWVDVRDVADMHLRVMTDPKAKGERFLATNGGAYLKGLATILKARLGAKASKVSTAEIPNFLVRAAGYFDATAAGIAPELGREKNASNDKAKRVLGWEPRSIEDAVVASAESCEKYGLVKAK